MPYHKIKQKKPIRTTTEKFKHAMNKKIKKLEKKKYLYLRIAKDGAMKGYGWHTIESAKEYRKKGWKMIPASQGRSR